MAIDDSSSSSFFAPWPDRLRHSAIILLAAGIVLSVLVAFGDLALARAVAAFICIAAAALVPWRLHDVATSREDVRGVNPVEAAAVSAVVAGMPDPAVLLDRAGRVIHLNTAAAQLAPALRKNELAQFALRSPEIITALREAIATTAAERDLAVNAAIFWPLALRRSRACSSSPQPSKSSSRRLPGTGLPVLAREKSHNGLQRDNAIWSRPRLDELIAYAFSVSRRWVRIDAGRWLPQRPTALRTERNVRPRGASSAR